MMDRPFIIYAEMILITDHETAKIGNFYPFYCSKAHMVILNDMLHYSAPELIKSSSLRRDIKSAIYSFGELLWEIGEEKSPHKDYEPIFTNSLLPKEYREITQK